MGDAQKHNTLFYEHNQTDPNHGDVSHVTMLLATATNSNLLKHLRLSHIGTIRSIGRLDSTHSKSKQRHIAPASLSLFHFKNT